MKMENSIPFSINTLIYDITLCLTNLEQKHLNIVKVNNENFSKYGDLSFPYNLKAWQRLLTSPCCEGDCLNILQHFLRLRNAAEKNLDEKISQKAFELLQSMSENWTLQISKCVLKRDRICLFLNRSTTIASAIKTVIQQNLNFGRNSEFIKYSYNLIVEPDCQSELTQERLCLVRDITANILKFQGCKLTNDPESKTIVFTTKSHNQHEDTRERYLCGIVKDSKESPQKINLTLKEYLDSKINKLDQINEDRFLGNELISTDQSAFVEKLAKFNIVYELLSIKPSRSIIIDKNPNTDKSTGNTKGVSFLLYNYARINAILSKYTELEKINNFPALPNIDEIDFSLLNSENEWELIYKFILGYPDLIQNCVKHDKFQTNPHTICLFLSTLCQKFSVYYRRTRILTQGSDHMLPKMFVRIYLLRALEIVLRNGLFILDIETMSRM